MKYAVVHGHFYQPPRENPFTGQVPRQPSAAPEHDWNARVHRECYAPNARAVILGPDGQPADAVNNYERISFNFGPTLLRWMEDFDPATYARILEADVVSRARCGGHGNALAQAYNHRILPLASRRDKDTQVKWGVRDFESRFGRAPEGLWLAETAVDTETLESLAEHGLRFTVLAPHQAAWDVDPTRPYLIRLPSGRSIALFFYDGPASRAVAFERLLDDGVVFKQRLSELLNGEGDGKPRLAHIATDGESYGHHHKHGEMALAYALRAFEEDKEWKLSNYGEFLEIAGATEEAAEGRPVKLVEPSSWSCAHGVERWRSDCGCASGLHPGWTQAWRAPLREALQALKERADRVFEIEAAAFVEDPWKLRDESIEWILKPRSLLPQEERLSSLDRVRLRSLLELQKNAEFMLTSCAWFFDDVAGLEVRQNLRYADRVLEILAGIGAADAEASFLEVLSRAPSNDPAEGDGRKVFLEWVRPLRRGLPEMAAQLFLLAAHGLEWGCRPQIEPELHVDRRRLEGREEVVEGRVALWRSENSERARYTAIAYLSSAPRVLLTDEHGQSRDFDESVLSHEQVRALFKQELQQVRTRWEGRLQTKGLSPGDAALGALGSLQSFLDES